MRAPSSEIDGWRLEDGERMHAEAPTTFWIPSLLRRWTLRPGDFAKLVFRIALEDDEESVERMWVIVRERRFRSYVGQLDNEPATISENPDFWLGAELPFEPRHVIDIERGNDASRAHAREAPTIPWKG